MMDTLGISERSLDILDFDFLSSAHGHIGILDPLEDENVECFSDLLPDILDHGFDHLSCLALDDDFGLNSEPSDLERDAVLQEFVREMQNTLLHSPGKNCLTGILGKDLSTKEAESTSFLADPKVWPSQLELFSGPCFHDDNLVIPKEEDKACSRNAKTQQYIHVEELDSDVNIDSSDDVDIETIDDGELSGKSCAEILSAKLKENDGQAARVGTFQSWKNTRNPENTEDKEVTLKGCERIQPKKNVDEKPPMTCSTSKAKFKLKDCNPNTVIEKIKQSSTSRRGSILISQKDVPQKCKNVKNASSPKIKTVKASSKDNLSALDHDYCSDVIVVKTTADESASLISNAVNFSGEHGLLELDNCMVVEEVVDDCSAVIVEDVDSENVSLEVFNPWTDDNSKSVHAIKQEYPSDVPHERKTYESAWEEGTEKRTRTFNQRRQQTSQWRSRRYRSSCSPSNSSSSHSVYRSCSRSPSRSRRRRRSSRYSRSSSRSSSRSRSWSRSPSRSWSRKREYLRFKRKERRSPSPLYQNRMRHKRLQDEKLSQIDERRVIFVGKIPDGSTKTWLRQRFGRFGHIQEVSIHFRDNGDNYGFVTFMYKGDALEALEHGNDNASEPKLDLCFGGRRQFCGKKYSDLDSQYGNSSVTWSSQRSSGGTDFDSLLNAAKAQIRKKRH